MNKEQLKIRNSIVSLLGRLIENNPKSDRRLCYQLSYLAIKNKYSYHETHSIHAWVRNCFRQFNLSKGQMPVERYPLNDFNRFRNYWVGQAGEDRRELCNFLLKNIDNIPWTN